MEYVKDSGRVAHPVFIKKCEDMFVVYVPGWDIYTQGYSVGDAMVMARDAIALNGTVCRDNGEELPKPLDYEQATIKAKENADEYFDYSKGILTMVDVDFNVYE